MRLPPHLENQTGVVVERPSEAGLEADRGGGRKTPDRLGPLRKATKGFAEMDPVLRRETPERLRGDSEVRLKLEERAQRRKHTRLDLHFSEGALVEKAVGDLLGGTSGFLHMTLRGQPVGEQSDKALAVVCIGCGTDLRVEP